MRESAKGLLESNTGEGKRGSKTGEELSDHQAELADNLPTHWELHSKVAHWRNSTVGRND